MDKIEFEKHIMQCLLPGEGYIIEPQSSGHEFPDGWCKKNGVWQFAIEVTRYLPERLPNEPTGQQQIQMVKLWRNLIWPRLDKERQKLDQLKHISISLDFRTEKKVARILQGQKDSFTRELIRFLKQFIDGKTNDELKLPGFDIHFISDDKLDQLNRLSKPCHHYFCKDDWPLLSDSLTEFRVWSTESCVWLNWNGPDISAECIGAQPDEFSRILKKKQKAVETAKEYIELSDFPLYLAIACDLSEDTRSYIFPDHPVSQNRVEEAFSQSGFDPATSPFDQVWLVSFMRQDRFRLYPAHNI